MRISPSIASSNTLRLEDELNRLGNNFDTLHVDIEDGNFVDNISFGMNTVKAISALSSRPLSIHLMVSNPEKYIHQLAPLHCEYIFVHVENSMYVKNLVQMIQDYGFKAGLAFNPSTPLEHYDYLFASVDALLVMTSEPDQRGNVFNPRVLEKLKVLVNFPELWVDGDINLETLKMLKDYEIHTCVVGRDIFKSRDSIAYIKQFQEGV